MRKHIFNIADKNIEIKTEKEVVIADRLTPFLCPETVRVDLKMTVASAIELPFMKEGGYWRGSDCYIYQEEKEQIFHCHAVNGKPYAVTEIEKDGEIRLIYLSQYEEYFAGSSGILNRLGLESLLLRIQRIILHASFVKYNGRGILFAAPSGVGKSTQADLWAKYKDAQVVNGDRTALGKTEEGWKAWGIPYAGTSQIYKNENALIEAIVILKQSQTNKIHRLTERQAFQHLYPEVTIHHWDLSFVEKATQILQALILEVPVFLLECLPEESAVSLLYETLKKEKTFF